MGAWRSGEKVDSSLIAARLLSLLAGCGLLFAIATARAEHGATALAADAPVRVAGGLLTCSVEPAHLEVFFTNARGDHFGSIQALAESLRQSGRRIDCATNGGIFGSDHRPLGWLVVNNVEIQPLNRQRDQPGNFFLQPNGALVIAGAHARIVTTAALIEAAERPQGQTEPVTLALQSGPILLSAGSISTRLDPASQSRYSRNAVCVIPDGRVVLAYSEEMISLYRFAQRLSDIGCLDALYLDGHLSQMYPSDQEQIPAQREQLSTIIGTTSRIKNE